MTESTLDWMKKNEKRYKKSTGSKNNRKSSGIKTVQNSLIGGIPVKPKNEAIDAIFPQKTLDGFIPKTSSTIFDEGFGIDDFRLHVRRWKEENLIANS